MERRQEAKVGERGSGFPLLPCCGTLFGSGSLAVASSTAIALAKGVGSLPYPYAYLLLVKT